jgi:hypothetical protein
MMKIILPIYFPANIQNCRKNISGLYNFNVSFLLRNLLILFDMLERDFLMRQLMQLFEALQNIIQRRRKGENHKAFEDVSFFYSILKIEEDTGKLSIEQLMKLLVEDRKLINEQLEMVAYVLKEQGELTKDESERVDFFRKAYFLLEKVERESITFSLDRLMRIEELKEYMG